MSLSLWDYFILKKMFFALLNAVSDLAQIIEPAFLIAGKE